MIVPSTSPITSLQNWIRELLYQIGLPGGITAFLVVLINIVLLFFLTYLAYLITREIILAIVRPRVKKSNTKGAAIFMEKKVFRTLAHIISGIVFYNLLPAFLSLSDTFLRFLRILTVIYILLMILRALSRFLHALEQLALNDEKYKKKPISSYIQVILILSYLIGGIFIISIVINKNPMTIITAFGAGMAIVLLIFKDLILGLVASVQVSVNDMVRVGDWISVHNYYADGEIAEINLTSVKVRNWDKTISNVPTYALVSNGFKNVREMQDMGFRRFLHHLLLDLRSIKKADKSLLNHLREKQYLSFEEQELQWSGKEGYDFDKVATITNLSLFRRYAEAFLTKHPGINNNYMVVRQLQQDGHGLPIEIYAFVKSVSFKPLNFVMSDVFEHLFTVLEDFDLVLYQNPTGEDIKELKSLKS